MNHFFYKTILKECCQGTIKRIAIISNKLTGTELQGKGTELLSLKSKRLETGTKLLYPITRLSYSIMEFRDTGMNIPFFITVPFLNFTDLSPPVGISLKQGTKLLYPDTELLYRGTKLLFLV
jgi:hypothetical protein